MRQGPLCANTILGAHLKHFVDKVDKLLIHRMVARSVDVFAQTTGVNYRVRRDQLKVAGQLGYPGPAL